MGPEMERKPRQRIGLFGGSFDPVHNGHLALARRALERWALDAVWFIPAADSPFKSGRMQAPGDVRLGWLRTATAGEPRFAVRTEDLDRGGVSTSCELVETLRGKHPDADFFFLVGADSLASLHRWHRAEELIALCRFVSFGRRGTGIDPATLGFDEATNARLAADFDPGFDLPVSSSDIRGRLERRESIQGLVPDDLRSAIESFYT